MGLCSWLGSPAAEAFGAILVVLSAALFSGLVALVVGVDWDRVIFNNHASLEVLQDVSAHAAFIAPAVVALLVGEKGQGSVAPAACSGGLLVVVWIVWIAACISVAWRCARRRNTLH
jgi:hypothetical protein